MTADLTVRLRDFTRWNVQSDRIEAADAIDTLTAERDAWERAETARTNQAVDYAARLAAAERVVEAAEAWGKDQHEALARNVGGEPRCIHGALGRALHETAAAYRSEKAYLSEQSAPTAQNAHLSKRTALNKSGVAQMTERQPDKGDQSVGSRHGPADLNSAKQEGE